ncbi:M48 family metallopeptidase [Streptacidiphilus carbonis]|jgi:Zn-dependent protease with chaperone function|uniref:M48 family metallopeptidase n=1 Tax=Streptacidiphilus carbonis TaxID=105422 RepID=UPI0005A71CF2|nr:M48 family metallopeptidase [Streptacidiphilus carbonis]
MRTSVRAVQALTLLAGFYVIALGFLAALVLMDVEILTHLGSDGGTGALKLVLLSVLVAIPLIRGVFLVRRPKDEPPPGVTVTEERQPELWARVRGLAEQVGTRAPDEIRLIPAVNAAVSENPRFLGLVPGHRRMLIGIPLLIGLTEPQLDAVLAHELGHYSNKDTRLAGITVRGRQSLITVVQHARSSGRAITANLFAGYAKLYIRVSESVGRRQELSADLAAARIAGRDHAADALRQLPMLDAAYDFYLDRYASVGWDAGLLPLPEEFYGGFRSLLAAEGRQEELDKLRREPPAQETTPYDSHPPISERVAALEALPPDGRTVTGLERPALAVLREHDLLLSAVAAAALSPEAAGKRPVPWDELARTAGRTALVKDCTVMANAAQTALGRPLTGLDDLLGAIDAGWLDTIAARLPRTDPATDPRTAARQALRPHLLLALVDAGRARFTQSWDQVLHLDYAGPAGPETVQSALEALTATPPNTAPTRALLHPGPAA